MTIGGPGELDADNTIVDRDPGPNGAVGQIITSTSECDFVVLAASCAAYVDRVATLVERGQLVIRDGDGDGDDDDDVGPALASRDGDLYWEDRVR